MDSAKVCISIQSLSPSPPTDFLEILRRHLVSKLKFLFSLNLCGDFARSIQAAKFHFNLLSPFTCSGHRTGGESHENVPAGTVPNLSSVSSTWPFQWLCCSLFIFPLWLLQTFSSLLKVLASLLSPLLRAGKLVSGVL